MIDYGYYNARIRGMKSRLLDRPFFERLIDAKKVGEVSRLLEDTVYADDIHEALLRRPGPAGVEEGLRRNLNASLKTVVDLLDGEPRRVVELLLGRWDVQNLKTVLRGKHIGTGSEEIIESFVPAGSFSEATLASLAKEPDIKATIDLMAMWGIEYARPLTQNFPTYFTTQSLSVLELALDKSYYRSALAKLSKKNFESAMVLDLIQRQIDFSNIMILLRLAKEKPGVQAERFFIEGGTVLDIDRFVELAALSDIGGVVAGLARTKYYEQLSRGLESYRVRGSLAALERNLEEQLIRKTISLFKAEPLSLAVVIAYLWAKVNEVVNLRILLRAKEIDMPNSAIRDALILV